MIRVLRDMTIMALALIAGVIFFAFVFSHSPHCVEAGRHGAPTGEISCKP